MEILTAGADVGAGEAHEGKPCSVCSAANGSDLGLNANRLHSGNCAFDGEHILVDDLLHVVVGVLDRHGAGACAVFFFYNLVLLRVCIRKKRCVFALYRYFKQR